VRAARLSARAGSRSNHRPAPAPAGSRGPGAASWRGSHDPAAATSSWRSSPMPHAAEQLLAQLLGREHRGGGSPRRLPSQRQRQAAVDRSVAPLDQAVGAEQRAGRPPSNWCSTSDGSVAHVRPRPPQRGGQAAAQVRRAGRRARRAGPATCPRVGEARDPAWTVDSRPAAASAMSSSRRRGSGGRPVEPGRATRPETTGRGAKARCWRLRSAPIVEAEARPCPTTSPMASSQRPVGQHDSRHNQVAADGPTSRELGR